MPGARGLQAGSRFLVPAAWLALPIAGRPFASFLLQESVPCLTRYGVFIRAVQAKVEVERAV